MRLAQEVEEPALQQLAGGPACLGLGVMVVRARGVEERKGGRQAHHGEVAGGPVDMQFAQQLLGQGHLVGGGVVGHVQPLHVLHQGLLIVLLPEQVIALSKQVLHQLEQKGLPGRGCRGGSRVFMQPEAWHLASTRPTSWTPLPFTFPQPST